MNIARYFLRTCLFAFLATVAWCPAQNAASKPSIFVCGDSTSKNSGPGKSGQAMVGWGTPIADFFDATKAEIKNMGHPGASSRTYYESDWLRVLPQIKAGDCLLLVFGINDGATPGGLGEETVMVKDVPVHTYGWYLSKMLTDARGRGARAYLLTVTVRNVWTNPKVKFTDATPVGALPADYDPAEDRIERGTGGGRFCGWTKEVGVALGVPVFDLTEFCADRYEALGREKVDALYSDHNHTYLPGAAIVAESIVAGLKAFKASPFTALLSEKGRAIAPADPKYVSENATGPAAASVKDKAAAPAAKTAAGPESAGARETIELRADADTTMNEQYPLPAGNRADLGVRSRNVAGTGRQQTACLRFAVPVAARGVQDVSLLFFPTDKSQTWGVKQLMLCALKDGAVDDQDEWTDESFRSADWLYPDGNAETSDPATNHLVVLGDFPPSGASVSGTTVKVSRPALRDWVLKNAGRSVTFIVLEKSGADRIVAFKSREDAGGGTILRLGDGSEAAKTTGEAAIPESEIRMGRVFSDHMVLQRDKPIPIWGQSAPGTEITVEFADQKALARAGADGKWRVVLKPLPASTQPRELSVRSAAGASLSFKDVLVGDVWQASGQSNMDLPLAWLANPANNKDATGLFARTVAQTRLPLLRYIHTRADRSGQVAPWQGLDTPEALGGVSGTAFFFGRAIFERTNVPIGLLVTSLGGTSIEEWFDPATAAAHPGWPPSPVPGRATGGEYLDKVAPVAGYAIAGTIWIQGEQNASYSSNEAAAWAGLYEEKFAALIGGWRSAWGQGNFPFIFGQLSSTGKVPLGAADDSPLAVIREAQRRVLGRTANTAMAVTIDFVSDWHYPQKDKAGERLALAARALAYGEKTLVASGPLYRRALAENNRVTAWFDCAGGGLVTQDGRAPSGFAVAGADNAWTWGEAAIVSNSVVVTCAQVARPTQLRYAWANRAVPNFNLLYNKEGLPASPFITSTRDLLIQSEGSGM